MKRSIYERAIKTVNSTTKGENLCGGLSAILLLASMDEDIPVHDFRSILKTAIGNIFQ